MAAQSLLLSWSICSLYAFVSPCVLCWQLLVLGVVEPDVMGKIVYKTMRRYVNMYNKTCPALLPALLPAPTPVRPLHPPSESVPSWGKIAHGCTDIIAHVWTFLRSCDGVFVGGRCRGQGGFDDCQDPPPRLPQAARGEAAHREYSHIHAHQERRSQKGSPLLLSAHSRRPPILSTIIIRSDLTVCPLVVLCVVVR